MQTDGVVPSVNTNTPLVEAYGAAGRLDLAEKLIRRMEAIKVWPYVGYLLAFVGLKSAGSP